MNDEELILRRAVGRIARKAALIRKLGMHDLAECYDDAAQIALGKFGDYRESAEQLDAD